MIRSYILMWINIWDFRGRARRDSFWEAFLCNAFIVILLVVISASFGGWAVQIQTVYQAISFIPFVSLSVRRLHDTNRNGWLVLWNVLPLVGNVMFFYMMTYASSSATNKYGSSPYGVHVN